MSDVLNRRGTRVVAVVLLAAAGLLAASAGLPAVADDSASAWSVAPADPTGVADGRTRLDQQVAPGASAQDRVVISNASTVERTFAVYGADAVNTGNGGYDLRPAATPAVDVGSWVTVDTPSVTIPALSSAVVVVTVAVPAGASPGDHPGGIAVSLTQAAPDASGVVVDTRVAMRLNVRVPGALAPALAVRAVDVSYHSTWVPFGRASAVVSFLVVNTGNVKIIGKPRTRITGPFGIRLGRTVSDDTQEILPGQSFTVQSVVRGVVPLAVATAVVDVDMAAAPGPDTELPLVSSTARTSFLAVPWTGLLLAAVVIAAAWYVVRTVRRRRRDGEQLWKEMLVEARGGAAHVQAVLEGHAGGPGQPGWSAVPDGGAQRDDRGGPAVGPVATLLLAVALAGCGWIGSVAGAQSASAASLGSAVAADSSDSGYSGSLQLNVPPAPGAGTFGGGSATGSNGAGAPGSTLPPAQTPAPGADGSAPASGAAPAQGSGLTPDLIWAAWRAHSLTPAQWTVVGLGGSGLAGLVGVGARGAVLAVRRGRGLFV